MNKVTIKDRDVGYDDNSIKQNKIQTKYIHFDEDHETDDTKIIAKHYSQYCYYYGSLDLNIVITNIVA